MTNDRYIEGFLAGQAVAYCERVNTGMSLAAQLDCPAEYAGKVSQLVTSEGCKVLSEPEVAGRISLWIYREELAARLISDLQSAESASAFGVWAMGKLLGYANHEVTAFCQAL